MFPLFSVCAPQGASALFDMIEYYESATHLNISSNKHIGTRGWQAAAHMMRKVRDHPSPQWKTSSAEKRDMMGKDMIYLCSTPIQKQKSVLK